MANRVDVPLPDLRAAIWASLKASGHGDGDAATLLDVVLYAQLRDNSQGVIKITTRAAARDDAAGDIAVEMDTKLSGAQPRRLLHAFLTPLSLQRA